MRRQLRVHLQRGDWYVIALNPETGEGRRLPPEFWRASGKGAREVWWAGHSVADAEDRHRHPLYIMGAPEPPVEKASPPERVISQREELAKLIWALQVAKYQERVEAHGYLQKATNDAIAFGAHTSAGTMGKRRALAKNLINGHVTDFSKPLTRREKNMAARIIYAEMQLNFGNLANFSEGVVGTVAAMSALGWDCSAETVEYWRQAARADDD